VPIALTITHKKNKENNITAHGRRATLACTTATRGCQPAGRLELLERQATEQQKAQGAVALCPRSAHREPPYGAGDASKSASVSSRRGRAADPASHTEMHMRCSRRFSSSSDLL
jgi:hypothetical protein